MISANRMEESRQCVGKHLFVRFDDGYAWEYEFPAARTLRYRPVGDEKWYEVEYRASRLDEDLVLLDITSRVIRIRPVSSWPWTFPTAAPPASTAAWTAGTSSGRGRPLSFRRD
jgi:hypothetical protein